MDKPQRYKLHHTYMWLWIFEAFPFIFVGMLGLAPLLMGMFSDTEVVLVDLLVACLLVALLTSVLFAGIIVGIQALMYKYIWYELSSREFSYYSGIISKKHSNIPYQKIQSVNQKASLIQRLAGVCTVEIETAGGTSNKAVRLTCVKKEEAERIRQQVFQHKQILEHQSFGNNVEGSLEAGAANVEPQEQANNVLDMPAKYSNAFRGVFGGDEFNTGSVSFEYGLSNKELFLSAITGKGSFFLVLLGILSAACTAILKVMNFFFVPEDAFIQTASRVAEPLASTMLPVIVGGLLIILLVIWVLMIVGMCISYGGFKARRRAGQIEVEYGILSHRFSGIDVARIQSINITQSFFQRIIGYCSISYGRIAASSEDNSDKDSISLDEDKIIVHPFLKLNRAQEVLSALTPEYQDIPTCDHAVAPCALRRAFIRRVVIYGGGFWLAVATLLALPVTGFCVQQGIVALDFDVVLSCGRVLLALAVVLAILDAVAAMLWYKAAAFGYDEHTLVIRNGGFSTSEVIIPRQKIQFAYERTNPFQRRAHVATLIAFTAAGRSRKKERLIDASQEDVTAWLQWMIPRQNVRYDELQKG